MDKTQQARRVQHFSTVLKTVSIYAFLLSHPGFDVLAGFGVLNLMFGMIVRFSRDRTALKILVIAAAPSLWPKFGLIYYCISILLIRS